VIWIVLSAKILDLVAEARGDGLDALARAIAQGRPNAKGMTVALSDDAVGTLRRLAMHVVLGWHAGDRPLSDYHASRALLRNLDAAEAGSEGRQDAGSPRRYVAGPRSQTAHGGG
jgi:hypothetical protein